MVDYNLCFCNIDCNFYIIKHDYFSTPSPPHFVMAYQVKSHEILQFNICIESTTPEYINVSNITKIFAHTFNLKSLIYNHPIRFEFLRDVDLLCNIGHCLIDCIYNCNITKDKLLNERDELEKSMANCLNKISSISIKCDQLEIEIQVTLITFITFNINIQIKLRYDCYLLIIEYYCT